MNADRRRHRRVKFRRPLRGAVGTARVYVLDASLGGLRVAHIGSLPPPGDFCRVELPSELGPIRLDCAIVRTVADRAMTTARTLFQSGLEVVAADRQSAERLRELTDHGDEDSGV